MSINLALKPQQKQDIMRILNLQASILQNSMASEKFINSRESPLVLSGNKRGVCGEVAEVAILGQCMTCALSGSQPHSR